MAEIHELSEILANQIAAGEVVERPASVVKELVENAIDAHASQIDVLVEEAGIRSIRIIDDGDGIEAEQVQRAFLRHATSKIKDRNDLFRVQSLGFRGEALPSIASIAEVTLETATQDATEGVKIQYKGGHLENETKTSARKGTDITVENIFFNTPARLKYLKSQPTELAQVVDILNRLSLSYPDIAFRLSHNGKELLRTAGNGNLQQVISAIYGVQKARKMLSVSAEDSDFSISGYIALPELTRANRSHISLLINGRYIKNFNLTKAVIKGYGSKLMVGRFPIAVLKIRMNPLLVDVNVHPQKQEVRLSKESQLIDLIVIMVKESLRSENLIPDAYTNYIGETQEQGVPEPVVYTDDTANFMAQLQDTSKSYLSQGQSQKSQVEPSAVKQENTSKEESVSTLFNVVQSIDQNMQPIVIKQVADLATDTVQDFTTKYTNEEPVEPFMTDDERQQTIGVAEQHELDLQADQGVRLEQRFPELDYIGQMHGTFLFAQSPEGLYLVDQHAAQERIKYEYYRTEITKVGTELQQLLVPITLEYTMTDMLKIQAHEADLEAVGIHFDAFGLNTIIIREHPGWFKKGQEEAILREMIDWLLTDGKITLADFREKTAIMMSCKRSIKANMALNDFEARGLLKQLAKTENPYNCPHGRPVLVSFSNTDMEKMFKRIQDSHESWIDYDNHPF